MRGDIQLSDKTLHLTSLDLKRKCTKEQIAYTTEKLLENISFKKLTINDIIENAGISKPTFYRYFQDKHDVVLWIYENEIDRIASSETDLYTSSLNCYRFEHSKKEFFLSANAYKQQNNISETIYKRTFEWTANIIRKQCDGALTKNLEISINFFCAGCGWLWQWWCSTDMEATPEEMAELTVGNIPYPLKQYLIDN